MSIVGGVRILLATDGSAGAAVALDLVAHLPLRSSDEVVVVSHPAYFLAARPDGTGLVARLMEGRRRAAHDTVDAACKRLAAAGVPATGIVQNGLEAVDAILRVALERHADLIVVGSRGLGAVGSLIIGSTARALAILSPVPVLVVRDRRDAPHRVLIAVDGSEASRAGIRIFARLPLPKDLTIELLNVLPVHRWSEIGPGLDGELAALRETVEREEVAASRTLLQDAATSLAGGTVHTRTERGPISETILRRAAAMRADLVVLGSHGVAGPRQLLWGSTAERVIVSSPCAVLVAPEPRVMQPDAGEARRAREPVTA